MTHPFESLTPTQLVALSPATRARYEAWFDQWMQNGFCDLPATCDNFDIDQERITGYAYDRD